MTSLYTIGPMASETFEIFRSFVTRSGAFITAWTIVRLVVDGGARAGVGGCRLVEMVAAERNDLSVSAGVNGGGGGAW